MDISTAPECESERWSEPNTGEGQLPWYAAVPVIGATSTVLWAMIAVLARQMII